MYPTLQWENVRVVSFLSRLNHDILVWCCLGMASSDSKGKIVAIAVDASDHSERAFDCKKEDFSVVLSFSADLVFCTRE